MKSYKKLATAGVVFGIVGVLAGCATTGNGPAQATHVTNFTSATNTTPVSPSNQTTTTNASTSTTNTAAPNNSVADTVGTTAPTNTTTSGAGTAPVTLEGIQYEDNALILTMTHGTMQTTYANPHFTTTLPRQFVVTLRNTNPGKCPLNQVQSIKANWAKDMTITKTGNDLILTFDLKQALQSFQAGVAGGFEIVFTFK